MPKNKPHKHAALIKAWADGATIQVFSSDNEGWKDITIGNPYWGSETHYRIKPETININGFDVPKPLDSSEGRDLLFIVTLTTPEYCSGINPEINNIFCAQMVQRGLAHSSAENAIMHATALLSFTQQKDS